MKNIKQINYWTLGGFQHEKPIEQALSEVKAMGLDGLELCFGEGNFGPGITQERCKAIRKAADKMGVKIATLATGAYWGTSLSDPSPAVRRKAINFTKAYLQTAKWLGAESVLVVPGAVAVPWDSPEPKASYAQAWTYATQSIKALLPVAKKLRVTMAVENVWNWFLADPVAMKSFVDQFKSKYVGVYFDTANCAINGYPEHWIEILGKRIVAIHVKNFSRSDCGGTLHGFGDDLMQGDVNFPAVIKALKKTSYKGPLTAEMIPFSRLPNLTLPDMDLARDTAKKLLKIFA